ESYDTFDDGRGDVGEANPLGPIGESVDEAQAMLGEVLFSGGVDGGAVMFAVQGMEAQNRQDPASAIASYQEAVKAGMRHPSIKMNLGALMVMGEQAKEALPHLMEAVNDKKLVAGALHAIGLGYYKLKQHKEASSFLIQSLQAVDTSLATSN